MSQAAPLTAPAAAPSAAPRGHQALAEATGIGYRRGEQVGYCDGWRAGLWGGIALGAALATVAWCAWLSIHAPGTL